MMRFSLINDEMQAAMVQFCTEQDILSEYLPEDEIESLVEAAFNVMNRIPNTGLHETEIYRYHFYTENDAQQEIFPDYIKDNGLLFPSAIHLATINCDEYISDSGIQKLVTCGYDVIYDLVTEEIRLLYRIVNNDAAVTSVYRVEADSLEDFDAREFIIEVTSQMLAKLRHNQGNTELAWYLQ